MSDWIEKLPKPVKDLASLLFILALSGAFFVLAWPALLAVKYVIARATAGMPPPQPMPEWYIWVVRFFFGAVAVGWICSSVLDMFAGVPAWLRKIGRVVFVLTAFVAVPIVLLVLAVSVIGISAGLTRIVIEGSEVQAVLLVLAGGALLYTFRCKFRSLYGLTEILAGVVIGTLRYTTGSPHHNADWAFGILTAGIYIAVRGLDNFFTGLSEDPVALKVQAWIDRAREYLNDASAKNPPTPSSTDPTEPRTNPPPPASP